MLYFLKSNYCVDVELFASDSPVCWGILDLTGAHPETKALFSPEDWLEMVNDFEQEVSLSRSNKSDTVFKFFDEVNQVFERNLKFYPMTPLIY